MLISLCSELYKASVCVKNRKRKTKTFMTKKPIVSTIFPRLFLRMYTKKSVKHMGLVSFGQWM